MLTIGLGIFASITGILYVARGQRGAARETALIEHLERARGELDRAQVFLSVDPQIVIAWSGHSNQPDIEGDVTLVTGIPIPRRILGFGSWLPPDTAREVQQNIDILRQRGEAFHMTAQTIGGRHVEIDGRAISGRAVVRIRDISGDRLELVRMRDRQEHTLRELEATRALLNTIPSPVWMRDTRGKLSWVNRAYAQAAESGDQAETILRGAELFDQPARQAAERARGASETWHMQTVAVVAGARRMLDVVEVPSGKGSAGMAYDITEIGAIREDAGRQMQAHQRTLDQLPTAVAIFDSGKRLVFHNAAYVRLWSLDAAFLESGPSDAEVLDRLRAARRLPEQADFRAWKTGILAHYQQLETVQQIWPLPDGRILRAVINPNPQGGVTYLFDDVTEHYQLESQVNALTRVQGETLDTLKEGVAVFGTDGRLNLHNPAFANTWRLDQKALAGRPHIDAVAKICQTLFSDDKTWRRLRGFITGMPDSRTGFETRLERADGTFLDLAAAPLPNGATLLTFTDVTASVNVERALKERNQALVDAEKLRNDFVHHVSYELRSPLTNIIGFIQLLTEGSVGPLNTKQREYTGYISQSSSALLAIINDILDLASIDTDAMELDITDVDIAETIRAAAEGVQDRLAESELHLQIVVVDNVGMFHADAKRLRQILFNLLSNAIGFSSPGQTVTLAALRREGEIVFKVSDQGRGIPAEILDRVFDRFQTHTIGSRHRGVGLGLSIVRSFVELHGGRVLIDSVPGEGTTVTCIFPTAAAKTATGSAAKGVAS
jgi:signal transduction histidine kinase